MKRPHYQIIFALFVLQTACKKDLLISIAPPAANDSVLSGGSGPEGFASRADCFSYYGMGSPENPYDNTAKKILTGPRDLPLKTYDIRSLTVLYAGNRQKPHQLLVEYKARGTRSFTHMTLAFPTLLNKDFSLSNEQLLALGDDLTIQSEKAGPEHTFRKGGLKVIEGPQGFGTHFVMLFDFTADGDAFKGTVDSRAVQTEYWLTCD